VFITCPKCKVDVFDSGLKNEITCLKCEFSFQSEKIYKQEEAKQIIGQEN